MNQFTLSPGQARKIILHAAGLSKRGQFGKGPEAVYKLIDHLGFVQIDANYVVERAHHLIIAARIPDYKPEWLEELQADGRIFEFFISDSSYMPMHDFRFSLPVKEGFQSKRPALTTAEINLMNSVLDRIERDGPLTIKDFDNDRQEASTGWWDWRPAKVALERLYFDGSLMTTRKKDFNKIYDLPLNLLPDDVDRTMPAPEEFARHIIRRCLQSMGIAYVKEIHWRARRAKTNLVKQEIQKMVAEGEVCEVAIEGLKSAPLYMLPVYKNKKITLNEDAFILSPFDPLNVFRHRLKDFFDFDYQVECFVPEPKRKYGYFSLPVLLGDTFVARMDSKADRKKSILIIHNLHFEPVKLSKEDILKIGNAIKAFATFNKCREITITKCNSKQYVKDIKGCF
ncbi:hypothetical protein SAMN05421788_109239 [Filimonas lacunae]|uniref:Winged helix-turn-helix domain-containing protein n=1 Tax=Filimonas lacunae TaxID=477680 RepID=A0A173MIE3_9BACT|nr:crosslink repair DNA glycosylase YcaQ family protein [Filimonas lacunae]BAV07402.1 hypothetical protein FLA_3427 [Filimonas lacunae]SIT30494.1 hypothetical protein SAMN05421788_109239 [Filimonas lacunae]